MYNLCKNSEVSQHRVNLRSWKYHICRYKCMLVCMCVMSLSTASWSSLWSRWCFCWLIPASPHACLTTQSSSLLASCPNQFICKQVCFFPLHPIVHTTPECIHNGRPLCRSSLLYSKVKNIMFLWHRTQQCKEVMCLLIRSKQILIYRFIDLVLKCYHHEHQNGMTFLILWTSLDVEDRQNIKLGSKDWPLFI